MDTIARLHKGQQPPVLLPLAQPLQRERCLQGRHNAVLWDLEQATHSMPPSVSFGIPLDDASAVEAPVSTRSLGRAAVVLEETGADRSTSKTRVSSSSAQSTL